MPLFMHIGYELYTFFKVVPMGDLLWKRETQKGQNEAEISVTYLLRGTY